MYFEQKKVAGQTTLGISRDFSLNPIYESPFETGHLVQEKNNKLLFISSYKLFSA